MGLSLPFAFSSKQQASGLGDPQLPANQTEKRTHHIPSGPAHCPARRCGFSSHFLMDKKLWTRWELSTSIPFEIQSWMTPL